MLVVVVAVQRLHHELVRSRNHCRGYLCDFGGDLLAQLADDLFDLQEELVLLVGFDLLQQGVLAFGVAAQEIPYAELQDSEDKVEVLGVF